jgi:hypothetical protein
MSDGNIAKPSTGLSLREGKGNLVFSILESLKMSSSLARTASPDV